jgi:DNA-binding transcriptional ArsR family regulator
VHEKLSGDALTLVAARFRLLSEPMRLRILQELVGGEKTVGELTQAVSSTQPNVSKHLKFLQDGGVVTRRQQGNLAYYSVVDDTVFNLCDAVCQGLRSRAAAQAAIFPRGLTS